MAKSSNKSSKKGSKKGSGAPVDEPGNSVTDEDEAAEAASDSDETTAAEVTPPPAPRKRGRPLGVKVGPRAVTWVCSEVIDGELVQKAMTAPAGIENRDKYSAEDAKKAFETEFGQEPSAVSGPFYEVQHAKAATTKTTRKRETVSLELDQIRFGKNRYTAIFNGWKGQAFDLEGHEDVLYFMYGTPVNPEDKKKAPPQPKPVLKSAIQIIS